MIENIKLFAKIGAKTASKWLVIFLTGFFFTILFMVVALMSLERETGGGHFGSLGLPLDYLQSNLPAFLVVFCFPIITVLYYICANKMAVSTAIFETWKNKGEGEVRPAAASLIERVTGNQRVEKIATPALLRIKLLDSVRQSSESKIKKRIIGYTFRKIRLDDINFSADDVKLSDVLSQKFTNFISESAEPSWMFFWILFLVHIALFIAALAIG
jgi:hypothetical protein